MTTLLLFGAFFVLAIIGVPIGVSLGLAAVVPMFFVMDQKLTVIAQKLFTATDSYSLMAIPLFIIAGGLLGIAFCTPFTTDKGERS